MNSRQLKEIIVKEFENQSKTSLFIWGKPGVGKSATIRSSVEYLNTIYEDDIGLIDIRLSTFDPSDIKGMPSSNKDKTRTMWLPPEILPPEDFNGILFLDELNLAPPMVQSAAYQLILDRRIGDYVLPENCLIIAAGNNQKDRGNTFKMSAPLMNRFIHLQFEEDFKVWKEDFAYNNGVHPYVISFLERHMDKFHYYNERSEDKNFPSPRTWVFVSEKLYMYNEPHYKDILNELIVGCIGFETSVDFLNHITLLDSNMPRTEDVLDIKGNYTLDTSDFTMVFSINSSIVSYSKTNELSTDNILAIYKYIDRLPSEEMKVASFKEFFSNGIKMNSSSKLIREQYNNLMANLGKLV
jgi:hypothetical protein